MALPDKPLNRGEQYLAKIAGQNVAVPDVPLTRVEQYLAKIAGEDVTVPDVPLTRIEQYLDYIAENGGGGSSITVEPLTVTQNGTRTAVSGKAYSPVSVNVEPETVYSSPSNANLSNPFSGLDFNSLYTAINTYKCSGFVYYEFQGIKSQVELFARKGVVGGMAFLPSPNVIGGYLEWDSNGLKTADVLMNGQVQDLKAYGSSISCTVRLFGTNPVQTAE